ncbi:MAG: archease [Calditrichaeota bacterium]|nr:archease [Calditrichota bacterium]
MRPTNPAAKYEQLEHAGDIRIRVFGDTMKNLFDNAAFALFDLITDADKIQHNLAETVEASGIDKEELLVNWLTELNFLFLTESKIFNKFEIEKITDNESSPWRWAKNLVITATRSKMRLRR